MSFSKFIRLPLLLLALGFCLHAQAQQGPRGGQRGQLLDTDKLKTTLELSEDQVASIDELNAEQKEQRQALRDQDFASQEDRRAAAKELMKNYQASLQEILTEEQLGKLREMRKQQRKKGKGRKAVDGK